VDFEHSTNETSSHLDNFEMGLLPSSSSSDGSGTLCLEMFLFFDSSMFADDKIDDRHAFASNKFVEVNSIGVNLPMEHR